MTVGEMLDQLSKLPLEMPVISDSSCGGELTVERRDLVEARTGKAQEIVAIFNSNGGRFGFPPLTEDRYELESRDIIYQLYSQFLPRNVSSDYRFYTGHGDYRIYLHTGSQNDTCYGSVIDARIIYRMVFDGLLIPVSQGWSLPNMKLSEKAKDLMASRERACKPL